MSEAFLFEKFPKFLFQLYTRGTFHIPHRCQFSTLSLAGLDLLRTIAPL